MATTTVPVPAVANPPVRTRQPVAAPPTVTPAEAVQTNRDPERWSRVLDEFSERNAGRRVTLEADDPEIGARAREVGYPLQGCVYDPFDGRLGIMLGDGHPGARHLMRGIGGVSAVEIVRGTDGRDRVMRVTHGRRGGQTTLVFTS
jgi:hypothetical protein